MKEKLKGFLIGFVLCSMISGSIAIAANTTTLYNVITSGVKIVVDGKELSATDANGNHIEPIIYNGTTYLPVRAISNAFDKAVYWDGPNYTVYLGNMSGRLEYPTKELSVKDSIGRGWDATNNLKDNLGNTYANAVFRSSTYHNGNIDSIYEEICNMRYSRFKGTIYVMNGSDSDDNYQIIIKTDGKTVYTSPEITKTTPPIDFNVDIRGCYDLQVFCNGGFGGSYVAIGDAGFYQ